MTYKIVFFDIDGTLLDEEKRIPSDTKEAIRRLSDRDIEVVIATGRAPSQFQPIREELGIDSFVSCNGSYVEFQGKAVYQQPIPKRTLSALESRSRNLDHPLVYAGSRACLANAHQHPDVNEAFQSFKILNTPDYNPDYWQEADIYQVYLYCKEPAEQEYIDEFTNLTFIRAHRVYMDVFPKDVSKASGIGAMLNALGISPAEAVAFGDGLNDKEMLSYVGMGIAMGNAHDEVKPYAKFTTKHVSEGGIVYGLAHVGLL